MCASWNNKKIDLEILASSFKESIEIKPDGGIIINNSFTEDILTIINISTSLHEDIPEYERTRLIRTSMFNSARRGNLSAKSILGEISRSENNYLGLPLKDYVLATNINLNLSRVLKQSRILGRSLTFSPFLPRKFDQTPVLERVEQSDIETNIAPFSSVVRVTSKARTDHEGFDKAFDAIDFLRGIWNYYLNREVSRRFTSSRIPVNRIRLGPIHTLHKKTGKLAVEDFWYEPDYFYNHFTVALNEIKWKKIQKFETQFRKYLLRHPYQKDVVTSVLMYTRALDKRDLNNSFVALWTLLEKLTASTSKFDDTIKRTLFLQVKNREMHKQLLENLRDYRNKTTHTDYATNEIENLLFRLKFYVEELLRFHIMNSHRFNSIAESVEFLDLPSDPQILKNKIRVMSKAIKFLK